MKHYGEGDWADFTRQVVPQEKSAAMERHLEMGCAQCSKRFHFWQRVREMAGREAFYHPPASAVRFVKSLHALNRPRQAKSPATVFARLLRDTFHEPLPAGARVVAGTAPRQLLYRAGRVLVDVRMDPPGASNRFSLVGQVFNSDQPRGGMHDLPVLLASSEGNFARTTTNLFGEFQLELDSTGSTSFVLSIGTGEAKEILIPIPLGGRHSRWSWGQRCS
jgi:hypothetical protein